MEDLHFFDLYSDFRGPAKSWSYNTLKVRAALNFKRVRYTQSWVSYPDIAALLSSLAIPPHDPSQSSRPYTLPAIVHKASLGHVNPQHGALMDSLPIVLHLEATFPEGPSLFPSGDASYALALAVDQLFSLVAPGYRPFIVPRVANHLDERGRDYFIRTRSAALGMPLASLLPTEGDTARLDELWAIVERHSAPLLAMLRGRPAHKTGPFFEGGVAGYADLLLASHLAFVGRFDEPLQARILALGQGEFRALYEACRPWIEGQGKERDWV